MSENGELKEQVAKLEAQNARQRLDGINAEMAEGCLIMICETLTALDPSTDPKAVPGMMYNDWIKALVIGARNERDIARAETDKHREMNHEPRRLITLALQALLSLKGEMLITGDLREWLDRTV